MTAATMARCCSPTSSPPPPPSRPRGPARRRPPTIAELLRQADAAEVEPVTAWLSGETRQGRLGVGWRTLARQAGEPAREPSLTVAAVDAALTELAATSGAGSAARRDAVLAALLSAATAEEQHFLVRLLTGELRQGALEGVVLDAVAAAADVPAASVRRAFMLSGRLPETAALALTGGVEALDAVRLEVGRPVRPDARQPRLLAGRRARRPRHRRHRGVQARRRPHPGAPGRRRRPRVDPHAARGDRRRARARRPGARPPVRDRRPRRRDPRPGRRRPAARVPGHDEPLRQRRGRTRACCSARSSSTCCTSTAATCSTSRWPSASTRWPACSPTTSTPRSGCPASAPRIPSRRPRCWTTRWPPGTRASSSRRWTRPTPPAGAGKAWQKVKPVHTLDLVVLGAEWGYGRRSGKLSNIHLGARDPDGGEPVMVGKTFKGMTDELLDWQTATFPELAREQPRLGRPAAAGARRRDRPGRRAAQPPLPRRRRPAVRPGAALPPGQDPGRGRHHRRRPRAARRRLSQAPGPRDHRDAWGRCDGRGGCRHLRTSAAS